MADWSDCPLGEWSALHPANAKEACSLIEGSACTGLSECTIVRDWRVRMLSPAEYTDRESDGGFQRDSANLLSTQKADWFLAKLGMRFQRDGFLGRDLRGGPKGMPFRDGELWYVIRHDATRETVGFGRHNNGNLLFVTKHSTPVVPEDSANAILALLESLCDKPYW